MNTGAPLRDREVLEALFDEVGRELTGIGAQSETVMVGGSWLLWHTQRAATFDVDSAKRLDGRLVEAAQRVWTHHQGPPPEVILVMKLYRSSPQDYEDRITMWPDCEFGGRSGRAGVVHWSGRLGGVPSARDRTDRMKAVPVTSRHRGRARGRAARRNRRQPAER